jgi:hypothetical protein
MSAPSPAVPTLGLLPRFAPAPSPPDDDPAPATSPTPGPQPGPASPSPNSPSPDRSGPAQSRPATPAATPTATSSAGKPTTKQTAELVAGVVGLLVVGAAAVISWRAGRQLRRPSDKQVDDFARPVAEILLRRWESAVINRDLIDVIAAGAVAGNYLADGPLIEHRDRVDPGVPHDLGDDHS